MPKRKNRKNKNELTAEDLNKICIGQRFDSIKLLCTLLGLDVSSGNTYKASVKTLQQYLSFEKTGIKHEIIITDIFESKHFREDKRHEKAFELDLEFQIILSDFLKQIQTNFKQQTIFTSNQLFYNLKCYSKEIFINFTTKTESTAHENFNVSAYSFTEFKKLLKSVCNEKVFPRLKRYSKKGIIDFIPVFVVDDEIYCEGEPFYKTIIKLRETIAKELGFEAYNKAILNPKKRKEIYKALNERLLDGNVQTLYSAFKIVNKSFSVEYTNDELIKSISVWNEFICQKTLNKLNKHIENIEKKNTIAENTLFDSYTKKSTQESTENIKKYFTFHESSENDIKRLINMSVISGKKLSTEEIYLLYTRQKETAPNSEDDLSFIEELFSKPNQNE